MCDPMLVTFEEGHCEVTVWRGSDLTLDVSITGKPAADVTAVPVAAPEQSLIGQWSAVDTALASAGTDAIYLLQETLFPRQGRVYWLRAHVKTTGTLKLLVLSPACGSTYCFESNNCHVSCMNPLSSSTLSYRCSAGDAFCSGKTTCDATCAAPSSRFGAATTLVGQYSVKSTTSLALLGTGAQVLTPTTPLDVEAGDILGIEYTSVLGGQLTLLTPTPVEDILISPYVTANVGSLYANTGGSPTGFSHALQAMFTAGSKTALKYTLSSPPGTFPISATVTNTILGSTSSGSSTLTLVEGVDQAIIDGPEFAVTNQATTWSLLTHTGSNLTYEWNITDGTPTINLEDLTHTFTAVGDYNISVAIYNPLSRKENTTTVSVLDVVSGLSIVSPPGEVNTMANFTVTLATGTLVTCEVDWGDGSGISTVSSLTAVPPSFTIGHTYTWTSTFTVALNCSNPVSHQVASTPVDILVVISNLRLERDGAPEGQTFALVWLLDAGTVDTHTVWFDGLPYALDPTASSDAALRWSSAVLGPLPVGGYPYNITVSNALSSANISGYFSVMQQIVNPTLTADLNDVTTDDTVTFRADVFSGSDVTVVVHYEDGSPDDVFPPATPGDPWAGVMTFTHQFIRGCDCAVRATFSNAATSEQRTVVISVKVGFSQIDWDLSVPAAFYLYDPPAVVNFQFSSPSNIQPTNPTVLIDWGDGAPVETYNSIQFGAPGYWRQYDDTGDYIISVSMSNAFTQKNYTHLVKVIEKLQVASIESDFPKVPLNLPFNLYFVMYRGDRLTRTNLTWDLDDGNAPFTTQRQGKGKNGRDPMTVTYTTPGTKTVSVQALAPLSQSLTATRSFDMIQGVDPASVTVTASAAVQLGQPTTFTIQYNANPVPDAATISIDVDADGTPDLVTPVTGITSSGDSQTVTFTYASDGILDAIATLHNDASSVSVPINPGVFQSLTGMAASLTFEQNIPPGRPYDQNGLNNAGLKYPPDVPVKFTVSVSNNAYVSLYTVTVTSGPAMFVHTSTTNGFEVPFTVDGTYVLDIKAENPLFSANIPRTIQIEKRLKGLEINVSNEVLIPGEPTLFEITMTDFTSGTCVYIDWDYFGDKFVYSDAGAPCNHPDFVGAIYTGTVAQLASERLMYNYRAPGEYTVRIAAVDSNGDIETANRTLAISYDPCTRPTTSIQDSRSFFYLADTYERSRYIRLRGFARINCPANLANVKSWNLYRVDEDTGQDVAAVDISSLTTNKAELYIPTRFLPLGTYKATYAMLMTAGAGVPFAGEALTYFQIVPSELLGVIVEGGMTFITVGTAQDYILEPLRYSLDPDVDLGDPQGLSVVSWNCSMQDGSVPDSACIGYSSASSSTLTIQGSALTEGQTYVITVNLQKGSRTTSAQLLIMISGLTSPVGTITCIPGTVCYRRSDGYTALESSRISLRCNCPACLASAVYQWTISIQDYRWNDGWRPLKSTDMMEDRSISKRSLNQI
ncbi:location of vulva defective 1 [Elysia marginata]|uniref:Location of vulva defective 1 n=1 Tax=Elysia marginata TaxID=1093978 RepID=A0AAV4IDA7_9GAST|nr:location of vulva defective 1 [Elysia marginata]